MALKYVQIAAELRKAIAEGTYKSTMRLPSEVELAGTYHANRQTVRKALSLLIEEGLIERRQGSGSYIRGSRMRRGNSIAILTTYINDYIFPAILQDAQTVFSRYGYSTMLFCTHNQVNMEREALKKILDSPICGVLAEGTKTAFPNPNLDLYQKLQQEGIPLLFFHGTYASLPNTVCISDDNFHGGYLLTDYLLKKGHTRIAGIFKGDDMQGFDRYYGYLCAFRDAHLPIPDTQVLWYTTEEKQQLLTQKSTSKLREFIEQTLLKVTAVVCYNDEIAFALIQILQHMHIDVPQQLAVVSFDNSTYSEFSPVKITSLAHGSNHIGRIASESMIDMMQQKPVQSQSVPWVLVEKDSSRISFAQK